ncbi:hypothetical protein HT031_005017 [Scenedesmus sp. PABB004]|nr:hypothetical protein HT031_005017 [Scenedesmus sp. PABB004]
MYKRDVAVLLLSCFALFLCLQYEDNFSFRKAWYHVTLTESDRLDLLQDRIEDLPPPLVVRGAARGARSRGSSSGWRRPLPPAHRQLRARRLQADLNGDGHLEVIIATHDYKLQLVRPEPPGRAGEGFAPVEVVQSFSLLPQKVMLGRDRRPVAMAAGFIDPEPREKVRPARKQVLVVVTSSWQVLAFDHNLQLMWETAIEESLPRNARLAEVAVIITPHQVRQDSRGLVVVGGSLELGDMEAAAAGEAGLADGGAGGGVGGAGGEAKLLEGVLEEELRFEAEEAARAHGGAGLTGRAPGAGRGGAAGAQDRAPGAAGGVDVSRHFSYYAFEGGRGESVWKHASGAFQTDLEASADELTPQDDFRIHADALAGRHFGELSCREFRESLLAVLPQQWSSSADSRLEEALFVKHKEGAGQQKQQLAKLAAAKAASGGRASHASLHPRRQRSAGFSLSHVLGPSRGSAATAKAAAAAAARGGLVVSRQAAAGAAAAAHAGMAARHTHLAHNTSANAIVAHVQDGIEVVHLFSGRTLCKLHLPPGVLHADINGDGVIDHVAVGSGPAAGGPLGVAGLPTHAQLGGCMAVATSGIPPKHTLWRTHVCASRHGLAHALDSGRQDEEEAGAPDFLPAVFLPVPRADGSYSHLRGQHGLVMVMGSDGVVTAVNARGEKLWQRYLATGWQSGDGDAAPTLVPLSLRPHAVPTAVLAVGYDAGVVVSEHGNELAAFHVAFPPAAPAVVADFDGDGLNDIIIVTRGGVFGYAQVQHLGGLHFGALLLTLVVAMGVVWYSQQYDGGGAGASGAGGLAMALLGGGVPPSGAARARKLRSTEYYYTTGRLTPSIYDPQAVFIDPTTNVKGVARYTAAVAALFDPDASRADLVDAAVSGPNSLTLRWRLEGRLKLGGLPIKPYTGTTVYTLDEASGLITRHEETWDISAADAFISTLLPGLGFGAPPAPPVAELTR